MHMLEPIGVDEMVDPLITLGCQKTRFVLWETGTIQILDYAVHRQDAVLEGDHTRLETEKVPRNFLHSSLQKKHVCFPHSLCEVHKV